MAPDDDWWSQAAGSVGVLPSLMVVVGLTLVTLAGHAWSVRSVDADGATAQAPFARGLYLGLIGHLFLLLLATDRTWSLPPWPVFAALAVMTLGDERRGALEPRRDPARGRHDRGRGRRDGMGAGAGIAEWGLTAVLAAAAVSGYALLWQPLASRFRGSQQVAWAAGAALFVGELSLIAAVDAGTMPAFPVLLAAHVVNLCVLLALTAGHRWPFVAVGAVVPAWVAVLQWQARGDLTIAWPKLLALSAALYAVFAAYPFVLGRRVRDSRDPYLAAVLASAMFFFGARAAFVAGGLDWMIGVMPVVEGAVLALLLRSLLSLEPRGQRDLGRLALVAGAALAFVTVAIPLQLKQQWITIGWALEGAALAWLYRRIPHRGLFYSGVALLGAVFVRLALNPEVLVYEPRGSLRIFNWYLYAYLLCAAAMFVAGWWLSKTNDRLAGSLRVSSLLPAAGVVLLFLLLNIEIADFYATGPTIMFRFGATVSQDLTYTIGWLVFGMGLLAAGIYTRQSIGARSGGRADRGHDLQVLPLRPGLARRAGSCGVVRRPGDLAGAGVARAAEVRPQDEDRDVKRAPLLVAAIALSILPLVALAQKAARVDLRARRRDGRRWPHRLAIDAGLLTAGAPFRVLQRGERYFAEGGLTDLRLVTEGGRPVPYLLIHAPSPEREWIRGQRPERRPDEEDQRLRGRSWSRESSRHDSGPRVAGAVPEAADARGQRRSRALDDARRRRHAVRFAGRAAAAECARLCAGAVSIPPRHVERHQQRPRAESDGGRRAARLDRAAADCGHADRVDRAASERTGNQPISRQAARRQAANRGGRSRRRARRRRRARVSPGGRERVPLRGARSRTRRARTGDAVAGCPGRAYRLGAPRADCRADGDRARIDHRRWRERAAGFARRLRCARRAAVDLFRGACGCAESSLWGPDAAEASVRSRGRSQLGRSGEGGGGEVG